MIGNGVEKRGLVTRVWQSQAVRQAISTGFIFDGNKLAWSLNTIDREQRITVDMDQENNRAPGAKGPDIHRVVIRQTNRVRLDVLLGYLEGRIQFDNVRILLAVLYLKQTLTFLH